MRNVQSLQYPNLSLVKGHWVRLCTQVHGARGSDGDRTGAAGSHEFLLHETPSSHDRECGQSASCAQRKQWRLSSLACLAEKLGVGKGEPAGEGGVGIEVPLVWLAPWLGGLCWPFLWLP